MGDIMFYTLILLLLLILIMLIKKPENESFIWIVVSICGFCLSIFAFVFYVFHLYECFKIKTIYFDFSDELWLLMWRFSQRIKLTPSTIYRLMNIGVVIFVLSFLNFVYIYVNPPKGKGKSINWKFFILPIFFLIIYDPTVMEFLFLVSLSLKKYYGGFRFSDIITILNYINKGWIFLYLILGVYWLIVDYHRLRLKVIKQKTLYVILCFIPVVGLYMLSFYWFPQQLVLLREKVEPVSNGQDFQYLQFIYGNFIHLPVLYRIYPFIAVVSVGLLLYAAYSRKAFTLAEKSEINRLNYLLGVTTLGSKIFTHAVKNDLIAIQVLLEKMTDKIHNPDVASNEIGMINEICQLNLKRMTELKNKVSIGDVKVQCVDALSIVEHGLEKANIPETISVKFNFPAKPVWTYMDKYYFSEVITSILQNAADAIQMNGTENGSISIAVEQSSKEVSISIRDNGCGISCEKLNLVFDPFFSTKPSGGNWGLGLFFCRMIVQIHNGELHMKSKPGSGSEVFIYLPSAQNLM